MPVLLFKSLLSIALVPLALVALFTMLELFGREEVRFRAEALKKIHRANGVLYIVIFAAVGYYCLGYVARVGAEPSARAALHIAAALLIAALLVVKILFVRFYRKFYGQAKALGFAVAVLSLVLFGLSGGYFLLAAGERAEMRRPAAAGGDAQLLPRTDAGSIERGGEIYGEKCTVCHDPYSNEKIVGPGHKGILKNPALPASGRPATPENVRRQLRDPYRDMPPFDYLSEDEVEDILAFLNTL